MNELIRRASSPGLLREEITSFAVDDDEVERMRERQVFVYDNVGNLVDEIVESASGIRSRQYSPDAQHSDGSRVEESMLDPDPAFGFQIGGMHVAAPNAARMRQTFDAASRRRHLEFLTADGGLIARLDWTYDDEHHSTAIVHRAAEAFPDLGGMVLSEVHETRDKRGQVIERTVRVMGEEMMRQQCVYNDRTGLIETQTEILRNGLRTELRYTYRKDDRGEWIEREIFRGIGDGAFRKVEVARRRLTYS